MSPDHPLVRNAPLWADTESGEEFSVQKREEPSGEERLVRAVILLMSVVFVLAVAAGALPLIAAALKSICL